MNTNLYKMIMGGVIADAVAIPYETLSRPRMEWMSGWGTYSQPSGSWSDASSIILIVARQITRKIKHSLPEDIKDLILEDLESWIDTAEPSANGYNFKIEESLKYAVNRGEPIESSRITDSIPLMLALPLYRMCKDIPDAAQRYDLVKKVCCLTHNNEKCFKSCFFLIEYIAGVEASGSKTGAFKHAKDTFLSIGLEFGIAQYKDKRLLNPEGDVCGVLESAIWAFEKGKNYEDAIKRSVEVGKKTSHVSVIAGAIAGFRWPNITDESENLGEFDMVNSIATEYAEV